MDRRQHCTKRTCPHCASGSCMGSWMEGNCRVSFSSDNNAIVAVLKKGTAKYARLLRLLQCLSFLAAIFQFAFTAKHILGKHNQAVDAISWGKFDLFFSIHPQTRREPVQIPQPLQDLVVALSPNWNSPRWTQLLTDTLQQV